MLQVIVETGSSNSDQPGHILSGLSGSDLLLKLSKSDQGWVTCEVN